MIAYNSVDILRKCYSFPPPSHSEGCFASLWICKVDSEMVNGWCSNAPLPKSKFVHAQVSLGVCSNPLLFLLVVLRINESFQGAFLLNEYNWADLAQVVSLSMYTINELLLVLVLSKPDRTIVRWFGTFYSRASLEALDG